MMEQKLMGLEEFRKVYGEHMVNHFPADEIKPLYIMENAFHEGTYLPYGYYEDGVLIAYTFLLRSGKFLLLDYFAVLEVVRGQGRGSDILSVLKGNLKEGETIFLEVEQPVAVEKEERDLQERRIQFYLRNEAEFAGVEADVFHVLYVILTIGAHRYGKEAEEAMKTLYHSILDDKMYKENVFFELKEEKR